MAQCKKVGCFLQLFTKGHEFKENTTVRSKILVKGTKYSRSATFGTFLQHWFSLGIIKDLMRQVQECKSMPLPPVSKISPEEARKNANKERKDWAIAMVTESITFAMDTAKVMKRQAAADRATKAALETRMAKTDKSTQDLLQNLTVMQKNPAEETMCRDADKEFGKNDKMPMKVVKAP